MQIVGLQSRTKNSKFSYRRSKNGWIKPEVRNSEANRNASGIDGFRTAQKAAASTPLSFGRIAKPLRGGGGGPTTTGSAPHPISGGGANPLARLQAEETGGGECTLFGMIGFHMSERLMLVQRSDSRGSSILEGNGWYGRLRQGVLLYKTCSSKRSDQH